MKKTALLIFCSSLGGCSEVGALPPSDNLAYQSQTAVGYAAQTPAVSDTAVYDLLSRLEQLQSEVQQLRGVVEEQDHTIADLQRRQDNMYSDLDQRIQLLSSQQRPAEQAQPSAEAAVTQPPAEAEPPQKPESVSPTENESAAQAVSQNQAAEMPSPVASGSSEQERYQAAYELLRNGHNAQAIKSLEALYADYPKGQFGDNAQYWLGEAYKLNREVDKARTAFNTVINEFPSSPKVPDALLKLGYIELEQQNPAKARDYLTRITASYPGTTAAHLAAKKLEQMAQ
ncbi:MAG: tol-pal system protein YbgF [Gammaproteobacteria bacterium]